MEGLVSIQFEGGRKAFRAAVRLVLDGGGGPFGLEVLSKDGWTAVEDARLGRLVPAEVFDGARGEGFVVLRACGQAIRIPVGGVGGRPFEALALEEALGRDGFESVLSALAAQDS